MLTTLLLWGAAIAAIVLFIYWVPWWVVTMITINKIPGPPTYPIIGNLLDIHIPTDKLWVFLRNMGKKYYPIYRIWSGPLCAVAFLCPEDIELLMSTTKHITKSKIYYLMQAWLGTGLLTSTGVKWQNRRKILTPSFHFNILQQFIPILTEQSELLINRLETECNQPHTQIVPIITTFTLHSICETAMGTRLDVKNQKQRAYVKAIHRIGELIVHRVLRPWLYLDQAYFFSPQYWELKRVSKFLHGFSNKVIKERKENFKDRDFSIEAEDDGFTTKKRLAMLDLLISAQKNGENIDDEGIREEVDTFMFEGHDTTAMCLSFTSLLLANHANIQEKIVEELRGIFGNSDRAPTYQDLQNMHYLEMVIKESLRMYPSVPLIARITDEPIHTHTGYVIPSWVFVHVYIYDLHHNPELYPDPEKFDPDRFSPENTQKRHPFAYIPFSAGPRNCIGQKFAILEIKTVISSILRRFILEPIDTPADIVLIQDLIIRPKYGIKIKFKPRPKISV